MDKMTAAEYLTERHWWRDAGGADVWASPHDSQVYSPNRALMVQKAIDAAEERAAWVAFAAGLMPSRADAMCKAFDAAPNHNAGNSSVRRIAADLAGDADHMLDEYRARFAVKVSDET